MDGLLADGRLTNGAGSAPPQRRGMAETTYWNDAAAGARLVPLVLQPRPAAAGVKKLVARIGPEPPPSCGILQPEMAPAGKKGEGVLLSGARSP